MLKFKFLIHKESRKVITYDKWLDLAREGNRMIFTVDCGFNQVTTKEYDDMLKALLTDDFLIIYDTEFDTKELEEIVLDSRSYSIIEKVKNILNYRHSLMGRYGVNYYE